MLTEGWDARTVTHILGVRAFGTQLLCEQVVGRALRRQSYDPVGSTLRVRFTTSKQLRWETDPGRCHVNWVVCDSDWEAQFCRVVESHPRVRAYVKNHALGLEVPYRHGSRTRRYLPDFVVLVDDGRGDDLVRLVVEIKGYRREDAKDKKKAMDVYGSRASTTWSPTAAGPSPS